MGEGCKAHAGEQCREAADDLGPPTVGAHPPSLTSHTRPSVRCAHPWHNTHTRGRTFSFERKTEVLVRKHFFKKNALLAYCIVTISAIVKWFINFKNQSSNKTLLSKSPFTLFQKRKFTLAGSLYRSWGLYYLHILIKNYHVIYKLGKKDEEWK